MKEIGGYFELERNCCNEFHKGDVIRLNNARNCLKYYMIIKKFDVIYVPKYTCDVVITAIQDVNVKFYDIDEYFMPINIEKIEDNALMLYVNYFGICEDNVKKIVKKYKNVLIDNSQAFFSDGSKNGYPSFNSARKFFGVADGAYLYLNSIDKVNEVDLRLEQEVSFDRMEHILKRVETTAQESYDKFQDNEKYHNSVEIKKMSKLTRRILGGINYEKVSETRKNNFKTLYKNLGEFNSIVFDEDVFSYTPLCYPLLVEKEGLREILINKKIYIPCYWDNVIKNNDKNTIEYKFAKYILPLPIDQRYGQEDMEYICSIIKDTIL